MLQRISMAAKDVAGEYREFWDSLSIVGRLTVFPVMVIMAPCIAFGSFADAIIFTRSDEEWD